MTISELRVAFQDLCQTSLETLDEFKGQAKEFKALHTQLSTAYEHDDTYVQIRQSALETLGVAHENLAKQTKDLEETVSGLFSLSAVLLKADQSRLNHDS